METIMYFIVGTWFFILGTVMGSFYNVLVDRLPNDQDVVKARSQCTVCHTVLRWYDLIPLVSFLALRGQCRYCGTKLSWQYPASELAVGGLFLLAYLFQIPLFSAWKTVTMLALWSMLFVVGVMDFKYHVIIDQVLIPFTLIGLVARLCLEVSLWDIALGCVTGVAFYGVIYLIARMYYRQEAFGMGDVLLLGAIGIFFDAEQVLLTGFLAFYFCIFFLLLCRLAGRKLGRKTELAFGPSVCMAAFTVSLTGEQMLKFLRSWLLP